MSSRIATLLPPAQMLRRVFSLAAILAFVSVLHAQSAIVGVEVSYTNGQSNSSVGLGDPILVTANAASDGVASKQVEFGLDDPQLITVNASNVTNYTVTFTPPAPYTMMINGVRGNVFEGSSTSYPTLKVTLVRREIAGANDSPLAEPSSIQWLAPYSYAAARAPYLAFNLGFAQNGEPLPPLRIPLLKRTTASDALVPPDTAAITSYTASNGAFQFSVPEMDVKLELSGSSGEFDLKFLPPSGSTAFATYQFRVVSWAGDAANQLKKMRVTRIVSGSANNLETTIEGYYDSNGICQIGGSTNTWTIEDWHTGSSPLRVLLGTRAVTLNVETIDATEFHINRKYVDTVEVRPSATSSTVAAKTVSEYNEYGIGSGGNNYYVVMPLQTTEGAGAGDYITKFWLNPNLDNTRGTATPEGRVHLEQDGVLVGTGQHVRTIYENWLDASVPTFTGSGSTPGIALNGGTETTVLWEMDSKWASFEWPKSIERKLGTKTLSKGTIAYTEAVVDDHGTTATTDDVIVVSATRTDYANAAGTDTVQTIVKSYRPDVPAADAHLRGRVYSIQSPTGAKQSFAYQVGTWSGIDADFRIIVLSGATSGGTEVTGVDGSAVDSLRMHANKSTKTVEYLKHGRLVRRETWVYVSGGTTAPVFNSGSAVAWETFGYTTDGRLNSRTTSTGASFTATWAGTRKSSQSDETGLATTFDYDEMDRVTTITRDAAGDVPSQRTALEYDAAHRIRFSKVGPASGEQLVTETEYDRGGRVTFLRQPLPNTTSAAGTVVTKFDYTNGGRDVQTTYNYNTTEAATRSVVRYKDGRVKDVTGSAVVEEHYTYDFDGSDRPRTTRTLGSLQKRPSIVVVDLLGRVVEERTNGFGTNGSQKPMVTHREYNSTTGLLKKTYAIEEGSSLAISGQRLMTYDEFGQLNAAGLDLDTNGTLDANSTDRFETFDSTFALDNGTWWRRLTGRTYHTNNSTAYNESRSDTRLTGLTGMIAQSVDVDFYGNATTRTVVLGSSDHTRRVRTQFPDGTSEEQVLVGSMLTLDRWFDDANQSFSGTTTLSTGYTYDALGRTTYVTDARTGSAETKFWYGTAFPREQRDARNVVVGSFTYDPAGRLLSQTDPAASVSYAYTTRGEVKEESGTGTHLSRRTYTDYGELKELKTYRDAAGATADLTTWTYDDNTGWLVAKTDAASQIVSYDYDFAAINSVNYREVVRHSARSPSTPTTSRYAVATGDLVKIDYTDGTTDVDFLEYTRDGRLKQVQDATGVRTLSYDHGQLVTEALPSWFNSLVLTHDYNSSNSTTNNTVKGRYERLKLGIAGDLDKEMSVAYAYDDFGRVNGVTADYKAQGSRAALNVPASYQYRANSSLWENFTQGNFAAARAFEPNRDVLTSITATHTTAGTVATFGYGTDDAGRRTWATQSGMAFGDFVDLPTDATYYRYTYNAAGELEAATGYRGTDPTATTSPLPGRGFGFTYDGAGNRKTASVSGDSVSYLDAASGGSPGGNNLNQTRSRGTLKTRVSGTTNKLATVTVGGATATRETTAGRYWDYALSGYGQNSSVSVSATLSGATTQNGTVQALTRPATETLDYDADGNLTGDSRWTYEYDAENRLVHMDTKSSAIAWGAPDLELNFTYDYLGRRVEKIVHTNGASTPTLHRRFVYDGWSLIAEIDVLASSKIVRSYAWGLDIDSTVGGTAGVGGLVLETVHSDTTLTPFHLAYDGGGNVTALVNRATGAIAASYEYGPFGENVHTQTFDSTLIASGQPFRLSTKFTDSETGLIYYGHRFYDASLGRFINRDPIEELGGNNLYAFVGNSPVNGWDYLGMEDSPVLGTAVYVNGGRVGSIDSDQLNALEGISDWLRLPHEIGDLGRGIADGIYSLNIKIELLIDEVGGDNLPTQSAKSAVEYVDELVGSGEIRRIGQRLDEIAHPVRTISGMADGVSAAMKAIVSDPQAAVSRVGNGIKELTGSPRGLAKAVDMIINAIAPAPPTGEVLTGLRAAVRLEKAANAAETTAARTLTAEQEVLYGRVKPVKGTRAEVWERSKAPDGKVYDPSGREIKPGEPWELGHTPNNKFSDAQQRAAREGWDRETWKRYQRDPDIYRPERPRTNAGHQYESDW